MKNQVEIKSDGTVLIFDHKKNGDVYSTVVEHEDYLKIKDIHNTWHIVKNNESGDLRVKATINQKKVYLHRLIMDCQKGMVVDHIDRNTLNNTRSNLRIVTQKENTRNRSTKYGPYIYYNNRDNMYRVRLPVNGKKKSFGQYRTVEEALEVSKTLMETL